MVDEPSYSLLAIDQSGELGGAELCLLDCLAVRRSEGHAGDRVALFAEGPFAAELQAAGIAVTTLPLSIRVEKATGLLGQLASVPRVVGAARRLARLAKEHDALYANTQKAAVIGAVAAWLARKPLIWHLHDILNAGHFSAANRRVVVGMTNRVASHVIANSQATADAYREQGGRVPVTIIPNGIKTAPFDAVTDHDSRAVREAIGVPSDSRVVGLFGRLTQWKGQHVLLEALKDPRLASVHGLFIGDALFTEDDQRYAQQLKSDSAKPPLAGRVHWLGHRSDVPTLMRTCDVIIHCSTEPEPFGRVIVEGMLAGRPVVAAKAGGAREIVQDGVTGLLTTPGDANALASAIHRLLSDPTLAQQTAEAGRESAVQRFGLEDRVRETEAVLAQVCGETNR